MDPIITSCLTWVLPVIIYYITNIIIEYISLIKLKKKRVNLRLDRILHSDYMSWTASLNYECEMSRGKCNIKDIFELERMFKRLQKYPALIHSKSFRDRILDLGFSPRLCTHYLMCAQNATINIKSL